MGILLTLASVYVPPPIRKKKMAMLFRATADAFRTDCPPTEAISYDECLRLYASYTREQAEHSIRDGTQAQTGARLFRNAYCIGRRLRQDFGVRPREVMQMGTVVYRMLGIDFRGDADGSIVIQRCFFSAYYSSQTCQLISALDEGLLVGLAGGGKLSFHARITDGDDCCRARLEPAGEPR